MEIDELVGREFIIKDVPLLYTIHKIVGFNLEIQAKGHEPVMALPTEAFLAAYQMGEISFVGEPVYGIKKESSQPIEEPTSKEESNNFFSFDDL